MRYGQIPTETTRQNAQKSVESLCLEVLADWRGNAEGHDAQLDAILRDAVSFSDSGWENESEGNVESDLKSSVVEISSPQVTVQPEPGSGRFLCQHCGAERKDSNSLRHHIKQIHERIYLCVFRFAGCNSTFAGKAEWKRHVATQHLRLHYWLCQEGACGQVSHPKPIQIMRWTIRYPVAVLEPVAAPATSSDSGLPSRVPSGAIFGRRDLYSHHLRRIHSLRENATDSEEARWRAAQMGALRDRCTLPTYLRCPAQSHGCDSEFVGEEAWDERMEHIAKHLEWSAAGREPPWEFGGANDPTLIDWASHPDVALIRKNADDQWELNDPKSITTAMTPGEAILALSSRADDVRETSEIPSLPGGTKEDEGSAWESLSIYRESEQWDKILVGSPLGGDS